jgi:hypothetical protein
MDADSVCNSCWEEEGSGAGATGADLGAAQQGMLQQWPILRQHDLDAGEVPDIATVGQAARRNPSSNATANLATFEVIRFPRCF